MNNNLKLVDLSRNDYNERVDSIKRQKLASIMWSGLAADVYGTVETDEPSSFNCPEQEAYIEDVAVIYHGIDITEWISIETLEECQELALEEIKQESVISQLERMEN